MFTVDIGRFTGYFYAPLDIEPLISRLTNQLIDLPHEAARYLLGITGPPGSGKSTLADQLAARLNTTSDLCEAFPLSSAISVVLPMDGFHLTNAELDGRNLRTRKGSPDSFHADAFISLLHFIRSDPRSSIFAPRYSRDLHEPVSDDLTIPPQTPLIIVDGNYLLLRREPWSRIKPLLDETWYLDLDLDKCMDRVRNRHVAGGTSSDLADTRIKTNDRPNALLVTESKYLADHIIRME